MNRSTRPSVFQQTATGTNIDHMTINDDRKRTVHKTMSPIHPPPTNDAAALLGHAVHVQPEADRPESTSLTGISIRRAALSTPSVRRPTRGLVRPAPTQDVQPRGRRASRDFINRVQLKTNSIFQSFE